MAILNPEGINVFDIYLLKFKNFQLKNDYIFEFNRIYFQGTIYEEMYYKNAIFWLNTNGDICYRFGLNDNIITNNMQKASIAISGFLGKNIEIKKTVDIKLNTNNQSNPNSNISKIPKIKMSEIKMSEIKISAIFIPIVSEKVFKPYRNSEFILLNNDRLYNMNTFKPNEFMTEINDMTLRYSIILNYIYHLANHYEGRFNYIINWLAYSFHTLTKTNVALVLVGDKDSRIDILFEKIIKPLFSSHYCVSIGDNEIKNNNINKLIKNKLFYNFNELSYDVSIQDNTKKNLSEIISSNYKFLDQKDDGTIVNMELFGQTLITMSKKNISFIEDNENLYTVFDIKSNFGKTPYKNNKLKDFDNTQILKYIKDDLSNFAMFLHSYPIDKELANSTYEYDDKSDLFIKEKDVFESFTIAIKNKNIEYFNNVQQDKNLYNELIEDFKKDRIKRPNIHKYFNLVHTDDSISSSRILLKKLKEKDPCFYNDNKILSNNGVKYIRV
jgi:hypothetical protein